MKIFFNLIYLILFVNNISADEISKIDIANEYYLNFDFENAKLIYSEILKTDTSNLDALLGLGNISLKKENYSKAKYFYEKVINIDSTYLIPYINLSIMYSNQEDYQSANDIIIKASLIDPFDNNLLYYKGFSFYKLGKYDEAIKDILLLISNGETQKKTYQLLADCYYMKNQFNVAIKYYNQILLDNPLDVKALFQRALFLSMLNKEKEAIIDYLQILTINKNNIIALTNLGLLYLELKQYTNAITYFDRVYILDSTNSEILINRAYAYKKSKNELKAKKDLFYLISHQVNLPESYNMLGLIYKDSDKLDSSLYFLKLAYKYDSSNASICNNLGESFRYNMDFDSALFYIKKAITLNQEDADFYHSLASVYFDLNEIDNELVAINKCLESLDQNEINFNLDSLKLRKSEISIKIN